MPESTSDHNEHRSPEEKLSRKILILFLSTSSILIVQGLYNISGMNEVNRSIDTVYQSVEALNNTAKSLTVPISEMRQLSMNYVMAPNEELARDVEREIESKIAIIDRNLKEQESSLTAAEDIALFRAVHNRWQKYKVAETKTRYYAHQRIRVAAFLSVTTQEKEAYAHVITAIDAFNQRQLRTSARVYDEAHANSVWTFWTLVGTTVAEIIILKIILFMVLRMLKNYIVSKRAYEERLKGMQTKLVKTSRIAGMAEVATGVLHNIGNVLNSVNVAVHMASDRVRKSSVSRLYKALGLIDKHKDDIARFMSEHPKGRRVPELLHKIADQLSAEKELVLDELESLQHNIDHIKKIVAAQQSLAKPVGVYEPIQIDELLEEAIRINSVALSRHNVRVERQFFARDTIVTDRHKAAQILINLIANAKDAVRGRDDEDRQVTIRCEHDEDDMVCIDIVDNGSGIEPQHIDKIFRYGFTTKEHGHGFGLHSAALAATELQGALTAQSQGPGHGATFSLRLPLRISPPPQNDSQDSLAV